MNEMTLPFEIRNHGGLKTSTLPSTLPLGHGSSPQYLILVIFAWFLFLRISRGGQIRKFTNPANIIIIIIGLLKKSENSRILNFLKSLKIRNSRILPDIQYL